MRDRYGDADLAAHFRAFDTICSATQDRQDAVVALLDEQPVDLMVVIGGYNSSNTCNLARICAARVPTFHIADAEPVSSLVRPFAIARSVSPRAGCRRSHPLAGCRGGPIAVGLTAGASTPNAIVGRVVQRLADLAADAG